MPNASRAFCQLDLAPLLETDGSETWSKSLREHALGCPCCALRLGALDRLNARLNAGPNTRPGEPRHSRVSPASAGAHRAQPGRLARMVWGPARRVAAFAAFGLVAVFLALAAEQGIGPGLAVLSERSFDTFPSTRLPPTARWSEDRARELASNGSPTPMGLMLPAFPLE
jgi:hypothetical protein